MDIKAFCELLCCVSEMTSPLQGKNPVAKDGKACAAAVDQPLLSVDQEEYYIPSVDLLTAQVIVHHTAAHSLLRIQQFFFFFFNRDASV